MSDQLPGPFGLPPLFDGKRVGIKGQFGVYPSEAELTDFLLAEGAIVADEISSALDVLILGKASARAKKVAEELISAGARIVIVDDLRTLWKIKAGEAVKLLLNPTTRARFLQLYSRPWLRSDVPLPITNLKMSGIDLRFEHRLARLNFLARDTEFADCCFDGIGFVRFNKDGKDYMSSNCKFARTRLANAQQVLFDNSRLEDVLGENISIEAHGNSELIRLDASLGKLDLRTGLLADSCLTNGHVLVNDAAIENSVFDSPTRLSLFRCNVRELSMLRGRGEAVIRSSKLESSGFKECKFSDFTITVCKFRLCYFENCQIDYLCIDSSSTFESCLASDTFVEIAKCDRQLSDRIPGLHVRLYVPSVADCPRFSRLVDVVAEVEKAELRVVIESITGDELELRMEFWNARRAWHCFYQDTVAPHDKYANLLFYRIESDRPRERDGFLTDFFRFAHNACFARSLPESLRVETSGCSVKSADFKALFLDALQEVLSALTIP